MILNQFINTGIDMNTLNSSNISIARKDDLIKAMNKTGLVQKDVQVRGKNGQAFTRKQWVKATDVQSTDKQIAKQDNTSNKSSGVQADSSKSGKVQIIQMLQSGKSKDDIMSEFEKQGVTWNHNSHAGINWMRASIAIQKYLDSKGNQKQIDTQNTHTDAITSNSSMSVTIDKNEVKNLVSKLGDRNSVLSILKDNGIAWKENSNPGINWMRAMQALTKDMSKDSGLKHKLLSSKDSNDTKKQIQELQNLVAQLQNPTAQQTAQQSKNASILKGITTNTMSDYEKKNFGDSISSASPENLRNYRTLGMCAGDAESEKYLAGLYEKYSAVVQGVTIQKHDPNIDADPLRNKLQGVVNKMIVGAVKSSLKNARKRSKGFTMQQKLMEPWVDPNKQLTDEVKNAITHPDKSATSMIGTLRQDACRETDCNHKMFHRVLDKFKMSKEYGQLAEEYDKILTEYDKLTRGSSVLQNETNKAGNCHEVIFKEHYTDPAKCKKSADEAIQRERDKLTSNLERNKDNLKNAKGQAYAKKIEAIIASEEEKLKELNNISDISGKDMVKANELRRKLFDPKFTDLNVNLYHHKMMANQLAYQYFIKKDFISEYPILSKDNLDKLDKADENSLTNLALYAGMFKPSLTKGGKSAKDALLDKYSERQAFLDAYGGVTQVSGNVSYAENNEIRCKVSKASDKKAKQIIDNISRDWDMRTHGGMKYKIKGVYEVSGLAMEKDFDKIKKEHTKYSKATSGGKNCGSDLFYHGTGSMATSLILGHSGEFKIVKAKVGRMLGDGIYLADKSSKSAQYISDSGYSRHGISGSLMIVEASLGDTLHAMTNQGYSHDSVFAGKTDGLLNNEWCVHNTKAVIPRYLVEMEIA